MSGHRKVISDIQEYLDSKKIKSTAGTLRYLNSYAKTAPTKGHRINAERMIKFYERVREGELFKEFLKEKAFLKKKKVSELSSEEIKKIRREFTKLENTRR